jgi:hypothetical protein
VPWVTAQRTASIIQRSDRRARQLLEAGRFPNAVKYVDDWSGVETWHVPLADIDAYLKSRRES